MGMGYQNVCYDQGETVLISVGERFVPLRIPILRVMRTALAHVPLEGDVPANSRDVPFLVFNT